MADPNEKDITKVAPMSKSTTPSANVPDYDMKSLTASVPERMHEVLASGQSTFNLDKAGLNRLALRLFVKQFYRGGGKWHYDEALEIDIMAADSAPRLMHGLPR